MARKRVSLKKRLRRLEVRLQRNPRVQAVLRGLVSGYLRGVQRTSRKQFLGVDRYRQQDREAPVIICCWHGHLAGTPFLGDHLHRPVKVLASDHADGMLIVDTLARMGYEAILLATSGDKTPSLRAALRALRQGTSLGLSTDGPMGPARESKPGAVTLASLSGAALVPMGVAARPAIRLRTWDRFLLPLPFGRCVVSTGDPIPVPRRLDAAGVAAMQKRLDAAIDAEVARCTQHLTS